MKMKKSMAKRLMVICAIAVAFCALGSFGNLSAAEDTQWEWTADKPKPFCGPGGRTTGRLILFAADITEAQP